MLRNVLIFIVSIAIVIYCFTINVFLGIVGLLAYLILSIYRSRVEIFAAVGNNKYIKGDLEESLVWLKRAYTTNPDRVKYTIAYGFVLLKTNQIEEAESVFREALGKNLAKDDLIQANINLSIALWKQGKQNEAVELLELQYEKYKNSTIYGTLGYYYILQGNLDKALEFNLEASEFNDSDHVIADNLAHTYYALGDMEKAEEHYEKLILNKPKFIEAYYNYGMILVEKEQWSEALEQFHQALEYNEPLVSKVSKDDIEETIEELEAKK